MFWLGPLHGHTRAGSLGAPCSWLGWAGPRLLMVVPCSCCLLEALERTPETGWDVHMLPSGLQP